MITRKFMVTATTGDGSGEIVTYAATRYAIDVEARVLRLEGCKDVLTYGVRDNGYFHPLPI